MVCSLNIWHIITSQLAENTLTFIFWNSSKCFLPRAWDPLSNLHSTGEFEWWIYSCAHSQTIFIWASRVAQWSRYSGFESRLCRSRPWPVDPPNGAQLAKHRPGEDLAGRDVLVPSRTSDSCGGPGKVHTDTVARCTVFSPTHWCGWLPG